MSDIARPFNDLLSQYKISTCRSKWRHSLIRDDFLKEAYQINDHIISLRNYLHSIRRAYLSNAPPPRGSQRTSREPQSSSSAPSFLSNQEKDSIDASSKSFLRDLAASLKQHASAESVRRETEERKLSSKYNKSFLGRWAAGAGVAEKSPEQILDEGQLETSKIVRETVLWYLQKKLEETGEVQREMMDKRLQREIEKGRSILYKSARSGPHTVDALSSGLQDVNEHPSESRYNPRPKKSPADGGDGEAWKLEEDSKSVIEQQLSPEQRQMFAEENQTMLRQYEAFADQVKTAERSMLEISELQTQLVQNLDIQSTNISQLVADSLSTGENVEGGNKQLKRATERSSKARIVFFATCGLCGVLVVWDLIF